MTKTSFIGTHFDILCEETSKDSLIVGTPCIASELSGGIIEAVDVILGAGELRTKFSPSPQSGHDVSG